ncbi:MAG: enoyl-CoA hydratase [Candidatus Eremiobacteraeota bacterium]|nr:enoyl-CoA hydratase [Candidatus Eremiobacteraeota bacterium]
MSESVVLTSRANSVLTLTLNRPDKLNAFNDDMTRALLAALDEAARDPHVRVVVLTGAGRGFSSGQDLEAFVRLTSGAAAVSVADHLRRGYNVLVTRIRALEKPVIASLGGIAAGVGLSIALCCDLRIAADDALLTLGFSKIGLIPDGGASLMLPLLAGFGRALELAWTSDRIDAAEAYRLGLVNRVVPAADLTAETAAYARRFAEISPVAAGLTKRAFNAAVVPQFAEWLDREADLQEVAAAGPDLAEGVQAFLHKRRPAFAAR